MESKVVIVTGASRGIGLAVAESLLAASHKVVLVSRSAEQLQKLKERYPSQVAYLAADMTVADVSMAETFSIIESRY
jgi:NADP-dependent 3-hydroxy acid dehydrogenase YdfG